MKSMLRIIGLLLTVAILGNYSLGLAGIGITRIMGTNPGNGMSGIPGIPEEVALAWLGSIGLGLVLIVQAALYAILAVGLFRKWRAAQILVLVGAVCSGLYDLLHFVQYLGSPHKSEIDQVLGRHIYVEFTTSILLVLIIVTFLVFELRTLRIRQETRQNSAEGGFA